LRIEKLIRGDDTGFHCERGESGGRSISRLILNPQSSILNSQLLPNQLSFSRTNLLGGLDIGFL
jgi:hypothetical protein